MVLAIGLKQREGSETLDDLAACLSAGEASQQFLQDDAGRDDDVGARQRLLERMYFRYLTRDVPSERERPDARVDEQRHLRDRSAL